MYEYKTEALPEFEWEYEAEDEGESLGETEAFFGRLAGLARQATQSPALRRVGQAAARTALGSVGQSVAGARGRQAASQIGGMLGNWLPEAEYEDEADLEYEVNPIRRIYPDALMEHLGHAAAECECELEAEAMLGALVPLAAQLVPGAAPAIMQAAPQLIRGVAGVARTLRNNPTTRPLVRALPAVVRRSVASIARQIEQGQPPTPQQAVRTLAQQTARVIGNPQQAVRAYQRSRALDRQYHRAAAPGAAGAAEAEQCSGCAGSKEW